MHSTFPLLLAPMEDVTDYVFRGICRNLGADILYTEFISVEGIIREIAKTMIKMKFDESHRPIGIQIYGTNIDSMIKATQIATNKNPDFIDINFGCPVRKIAARGCGSGILNDIPRMLEITKAVISSTHLPVTVKTRIGWDDKMKNIVEVAEKLQDIGVKALAIHGRTRAQMYKGDADWTLINEVKNNPAMFIPVYGNGDVDSPEKALEMKNKYNVDGIMIGRAAVGNPWIFKQVKEYFETGILPQPVPLNERIDVCLKHLQKSIEHHGERHGIAILRKHYTGYFKAIPDFKPYRLKLVTTNSYQELEDTLNVIREQFCNLY